MSNALVTQDSQERRGRTERGPWAGRGRVESTTLIPGKGRGCVMVSTTVCQPCGHLTTCTYQGAHVLPLGRMWTWGPTLQCSMKADRWTTRAPAGAQPGSGSQGGGTLLWALLWGKGQELEDSNHAQGRLYCFLFVLKDGQGPSAMAQQLNSHLASASIPHGHQF